MRPDDSGAATVWAVAAIAAMVVIAGAVFSFGSVVLARQRAANTADLAALAAAGQTDRGSEVACARARSVADGMAVRLLSCRLRQWDALVEVEAGMPGGLGVVSAHARAGPVPANPSDVQSRAVGVTTRW
jgi:secretion/DNA translocation related TadE-like protein